MLSRKANKKEETIIGKGYREEDEEDEERKEEKKGEDQI